MSGQCGLNLFLNPIGTPLICVPVVLLAPACFDDFGFCSAADRDRHRLCQNSTCGSIRTSGRLVRVTPDVIALVPPVSLFLSFSSFEG